MQKIRLNDVYNSYIRVSTKIDITIEDLTVFTKNLDKLMYVNEDAQTDNKLMYILEAFVC